MADATCGLGGPMPVELAGGVRLLTRRDHPVAAAGPMPDDGRRRKHARSARIITMAWGDRYIEDLLELTLPALLAPGNLPAFAERFDCELVIVTETRLFTRVAASAAALPADVDLRLIPIDDLLSPWYGITLTYALVRGFADLGAAMTDTHLVFLNADFIIADGSLARLAEAIDCGERLVVAPSYCMNLEDTVDLLRARRDPASGALSLAKRELAAIIIANRHNTIRAKTINQQLFRIHRYDQFYWYVDEQTLLGRQLPIAVVYMRPERALTELLTFWDYGVISEYCPTFKPCVLGDSDDFLMAELRSKGTFRELLHLGWPTVEEIAADLSSFTTRDHRDYGRYTLRLHAGDLPSHIASAERDLAAFVDGVYARLTPPIDYRNHPFWAPQFPQFIARQRQALREARGGDAADGEPGAPGPAGPAAAAAGARDWLRRRRAGLAAAATERGAAAYRALFGALPRTTPYHPYHAMLRPVVAALDEAADRRHILIVSSGGALTSVLAGGLAGDKLAVTPGLLASKFYQASLQDRPRFDQCFCDLGTDDLAGFGKTFDIIRPLLMPGARIVIAYLNLRERPIDDQTYEFTSGLFPRVGRARIALAGSYPGALAVRWYARALARFNVARPTGMLALAAVLALCAPFARLASWLEQRRSPTRLPKRCTSMTIVIDLP